MNALIAGINLAQEPGERGHGYFNGHDLLKDLSGKNGQSMRTVAMGYVMAIHDATLATRSQTPRVPSPDQRPTVAERTLEVEAWLRENPDRLDGIAAELVRCALGAPTAADHADSAVISQSVRASRRFSPRQLAAAIGCCALMLAAGAGLMDLRGDPPSPNAAAIAKNIELVERSEDVVNLILEERRYEKDAFLNIGDHFRFDHYSTKWIDSRAHLQQAIARLAALDLGDTDRKALNDIEKDFTEYGKGCDQIIGLILHDEIQTPQDANLRFMQFKKPVQRMEYNAAALVSRVNKRVDGLV